MFLNPKKVQFLGVALFVSKVKINVFLKKNQKNIDFSFCGNIFQNHKITRQFQNPQRIPMRVLEPIDKII